MSVDTAEKLIPTHPTTGKLKSSFKNGWSPTFITIKLQRVALIQILGHALGSKGYRKWRNQKERDIGIKHIIDTWETTVLNLPWPDIAVAHQLMNEQYGPSY